MIRFLTAGFVCLIAMSSSSQAEQVQNVLMIAVDDLGNVFEEPRPAGLKTPHIDELMSRGVYFQRAYCQIPLCNPSRASVLTGLRPDTTTVWDLDRHFRHQLPEVVTLPQLFRQNGYTVARVGKLYHYDVPRGIGTSGLDDPASWSHVVNPKGRDVLDEALITNPTPHKAVSAAMCWLEADGTDQEQTDGMIATQAIELMKAYQQQSFFLGVGFFRPHTPYVAPKSHFEKHPLAQVELKDVPEGDRNDIPTAAIPHNIPNPNYHLSEQDLQKSLQAYVASVSLVDAQVGRLLDALDELQLTESTMIVFWSDHGYHLGEHHLWQKRTLFDQSARAPVIIAGAGVSAKGEVSQRVVEFIDLYPTVADAVLGEVPKQQQGRSLKPLLSNPHQNWDHPAFTQILRPYNNARKDGKPVMGASISTERYRYVEWNAGAEGAELYDLKTDPNEWTNLAESPEHQPLRKKLQLQLQQGVATQPPETPVNPKRL